MQHVRELFKSLVHVLEGETGRAAGEPCEAMKSASCLSAHRLEELPPFFICSWISTSSSSLNDCTHTLIYDHTCTYTHSMKALMCVNILIFGDPWNVSFDRCCNRIQIHGGFEHMH